MRFGSPVQRESVPQVELDQAPWHMPLPHLCGVCAAHALCIQLAAISYHRSSLLGKIRDLWFKKKQRKPTELRQQKPCAGYWEDAPVPSQDWSSRSSPHADSHPGKQKLRKPSQ